MYDDDDLSLLDAEVDLESPLDQMAAVDDPAEAQPDVEEMLALLQAPEVSQRMMAARAFCELQDQRATPFLIAMLLEPCPLVRVSAAYALGRNPSLDAVTPLITRYHQDWNGYVRKGVVWALGNCRDRRALVPLVEALQTDITAVRLWAASSLGQMAEVDVVVAEAAIAPIAETLRQDPMAAVRSNCAWSMGQLCQSIPLGETYTQGVEALLAALQDNDLGVQEDAKAALLKLGDPRGLQTIEELETEGLL
ncbi:HEAT repeat domain-containing protein [Synechococcales cyanobacterium C]|uniref:HEAT repeat domain-containing protein n=1 Tax=Petrachloros mirabilis ULC683 TaxID=2781853 RepID=A0A8K1ZW10_9CYAN|nr:HEAT repeat domain-containing protein [Petrachloros mirabilis]NCJ05913.1 HEAT repeat domain-containing protein [Petrachloros mirabilis ULC683]